MTAGEVPTARPSRSRDYGASNEQAMCGAAQAWLFPCFPSATRLLSIPNPSSSGLHISLLLTTATSGPTFYIWTTMQSESYIGRSELHDCTELRTHTPPPLCDVSF